MKVRWLHLILVLTFKASVAQAQVRISPYAAGALGVSDLRTRFPFQTSPPTGNFVTDHFTNVLAAVNIGLQVGPHFAVDAGLRSTLEIGQPFRVLTLGPAVRWGQRAQIHLRGGLGRVQGFQSIACVTATSSCPRYTSEWLNGFDVSAGVDFRSGTRWSLGPVAWWAQSTTGSIQYGSIGLGVQLRHR